MWAYFHFGDYLFSYNGKDFDTNRRAVTVDRIVPEYEHLEIVVDIESAKIIRKKKDVSEYEGGVIESIVNDRKKEFNFDLPKSYFSPKDNIVRDNSILPTLLSNRFEETPDILNEVKLQYAVLRSHCLQRFNTEYLRSVIDSQPTHEEYEEYKFRLECFNEDTYDEWSNYHTQKGWRKLGYTIKRAYIIDGLDDVFIVSDGKHCFDYLIKQGDRVSRLDIPGEFVGVGGFLWVQPT